MKSARTTRLAGVAALAVGLALPATATATPSASPETAPHVTAAMSAAMQRDLRLTADQVQSRMNNEAAATRTEQTARGELGASYAGSWFDATTGKLIVQTTQANAVVHATGATVVAVRYSGATLSGVKSRIDARAGRPAPAAINGWYVDTRSDSVVITVNQTKMDTAATTFVNEAKALHQAV